MEIWKIQRAFKRVEYFDSHIKTLHFKNGAYTVEEQLFFSQIRELLFESSLNYSRAKECLLFGEYNVQDISFFTDKIIGSKKERSAILTESVAELCPLPNGSSYRDATKLVLENSQNFKWGKGGKNGNKKNFSKKRCEKNTDKI